MRLVLPTATPCDAILHPACRCEADGLPKRIFLARHGLSAWNGTKRVSGQADPPLAAEGQMQAERLRRVLEHEPLTAIYSSSLSRAIQTACPAAEAHGLDIIRCDDLREQHHGILEGRFRDHRDPEAQRLWRERSAARYSYRLPGGESLADVEARVAPLLNEILQANRSGTILIVAHRNTNRVILRMLLGWTWSCVQNLRIRNSLLYEIAPGLEPLVQTVSLNEDDTGRKYEGVWA